MKRVAFFSCWGLIGQHVFYIMRWNGCNSLCRLLAYFSDSILHSACYPQCEKNDSYSPHYLFLQHFYNVHMCCFWTPYALPQESCSTPYAFQAGGYHHIENDPTDVRTATCAQETAPWLAPGTCSAAHVGKNWACANCLHLAVGGCTCWQPHIHMCTLENVYCESGHLCISYRFCMLQKVHWLVESQS